MTLWVLRSSGVGYSELSPMPGCGLMFGQSLAGLLTWTRGSAFVISVLSGRVWPVAYLFVRESTVEDLPMTKDNYPGGWLSSILDRSRSGRWTEAA